MLAEKATAEKVAFMVRHTTGILCVALTQERARKLRLPLMVEETKIQKRLHSLSLLITRWGLLLESVPQSGLTLPVHWLITACSTQISSVLDMFSHSLPIRAA